MLKNTNFGDTLDFFFLIFADTASSIWKWITSPFRARYRLPMLQNAPTRGDNDLYYLHGDELIKQCVDNNYRYGDRIN